MLEPLEYKTFKNLYLVLEPAQSDLKKLVKTSIFLTDLHIQTIMYNLLCGLKYMHSGRILHRDIKPANILINEDCTIKICDFGLARSLTGLEDTKTFIVDAYKVGRDEEWASHKVTGDIGGSGPATSIEDFRIREETIRKDIFEGVATNFDKQI